MKILTRLIILNHLVEYGTLSLQELADPEKLGMKPDIGQLSFLLAELKKAGDVVVLNPMTPDTYSISIKHRNIYLADKKNQPMPGYF